MLLKYLNFLKSYRFIFLILGLLSFEIEAQQLNLLEGKVTADGSGLENIHIINLNLSKGTTTDAEGYFKIQVREQDSLLVSSVQFEKKVIKITEKILEEVNFMIELSTEVNELTEVVVDDIKLSGYLSNDVNRISMKEWETKNKLQVGLDKIIARDRELNPVASAEGGIRFDKIAGLVIDRLKNNAHKEKTYSPRAIINKSLDLVGYGFFRRDLELKENEICNFLFFCAKDPEFKSLTLRNNPLSLIDYFHARIGDFKTLRGDLLNEEKQIPG